MFLSFGENCLTDNILERYHIKSFSTPFSSGRSNVEYILQIEKDRYKDFVNPQYLEYACVDGHRVVRLNRYSQLDNTYNRLHMMGFAFTHHDVLGETATREKLKLRASRMMKLKTEKSIFFITADQTPKQMNKC